MLEIDKFKNEVVLLLGENLGVQRGSIYQIISSEKIKRYGEREVPVPGRPVGFVRIEEVAKDASVGKIVRRWGKINTGYQARIQKTFDNNYYAGMILTENEFGFPMTFMHKPFNKFEFKWGLQPGGVINTRDSSNTHFSLGIPLLMTYKLINLPRFTLGLTNNLYPGWIWGKDVEDNSITSFRSKFNVGAEITFVTKPTRDLVLSVEYSLLNRFGDWQNTKKRFIR